MEEFTDSDFNSAMCPSTTFYNILNQIQASNLNFQLQISPFSAVISLKKSFVKDKSGTILFPKRLPNAPIANTEYFVNKNGQLEKDILKLRNDYELVVEDCTKKDEKVENVLLENESLKSILSEKETQLQACKKESLLLEARLQKAEDKLVKYSSETKDRESKLSIEIATLKSRVNEDSETILKLKTEAKSAIKVKKSLEKNIYDFEKRIDNLTHNVESLKTEKVDLSKEINKLQNHSKPIKMTKSVSTQTHDDPNNNVPIQPPSIRSSSTSSQTLLEYPSLNNDLLSKSEASLSFECYVCNKVFCDMSQIEKHTNDDHDIKLNLEMLVNDSEEDSFVRFVKSIVMEPGYTSARMNLYPNHGDHIEERIKIRLLAQKKLEICSWHIGNNLKRIAEENFKYPETNCGLAEV